MVRGILLSIFLLITFQNYAEENELEEAFESTLSETKSLLPTTVHNVSVISGEWIDSETDFYIEGPEPLSLTRCYSPGFTPNPIKGHISDDQIDYYAKNPVAISNYHCGSSWFFNRPSRLHLQTATQRAIFSHISGFRATYKQTKSNPEQPHIRALIIKEDKGLTNCVSSEISGKNNPHNTILYYNDQDQHCSAVTGSGHITYFSKQKSMADFEKKPSGNYIIRKENTLTSTNSTQNLGYAQLIFETEGDTIKVTSSDGKKAFYKFKETVPSEETLRTLKESLKEKEYREDRPPDRYPEKPKSEAELEKERRARREYYLKQITFTHKPEQQFKYTNFGRLASIQYPNNRCIELNYDGKRVSELKVPIGTDPTPVTLYTFRHKHKTFNQWHKEKYVTVIDANQHKSQYTQNKEKRLIAHNKYLGNKNYSLYCTEEYVWDDDYEYSETESGKDLIRFIPKKIYIPPFNPGKGLLPSAPIIFLPVQPPPPVSPQSTPSQAAPQITSTQEKLELIAYNPYLPKYTLAELIKLAIEAKAKKAERKKEAAEQVLAYRKMIQEIASAQNSQEVINKYIEQMKPLAKVPLQNYYTSGEGNLLGKYLKDAHGNIHLARFFDYDEEGNILIDTTFGNLTGTQSSYIQLDASRQPIQGGESYSKHYAYSADGLNLLLMEKEDSGKSLLYFYYPNTDLPAAKLLKDKEQIQLREFYEYDTNTVLIKKIRDNGTGLEKDDLTHVTERRITTIIPRKELPIGLPEIVVESYFDFNTGKEECLNTTHNAYSLAGKLLQKDCFDSTGKHYATWKWEYDAHGNLTKEVDPLGKIILKQYDDNDNLIIEQGPNYIKESTYDYSNRLTVLKETRDNQTFSTSYEYDVLGNRMATIDRARNTTRYEYDELNRLIKTIYPSVMDENEKPVQYSSTTEYDIFNHPISVKDPKGNITTTTYNAYGKPIEIKYADGTIERFEYNLNGTLAKSISKSGAITQYTRDSLGRILIEEVFSPSYEKLSQKTFVYKGARLISSTDPEGCVTHFTYDGAGRLIQTMRGNQKKTIQYNSQGQIGKTVEGNRIEAFVYDIFGRVTEETIQNTKEEILRKISYSYDVDGNRETIEEETQAGKSLTRSQYNSEKKPIKIIDALGHATHIDYDYNYKEENISLLKITTTDPLGKKGIQFYNALGRLIKTTQTNAYGLLLAQEKLFYDGNGNLTRSVHSVIEEGKPLREIITLIGYNEVNAQISLIEACGTPDQRITYLRYNAIGQKEQIIKPDGVTLNHSYDILGRLSTIYDSQKTIHYTYEYNRNNQVKKVLDHLNKTETIRQYDHQGNLIEEKLSNNLVMKYRYDTENQLTHVDLPDRSGIEYVYDAAFLKSVNRIKNKKRLYSHLYQSHDRAGNLLEAENIYKKPIQFKYDLLKRPIQITTPHWSQTMPQNAYDPLGRLTTYEIQDSTGKTPYQFQYNDLNGLTSEKGHQTHSYTLDSLHNRTSKDGTTCSLNDLNQLMQHGDCQYKYDRNGNLIEKIDANPMIFQYDTLDRLISITKNGLTTTYQYDSFNRRISKTQNDQVQRFLYQGQDEIGSANANNQIIELRILGKGIEAEIGAAIAFELSNMLYVPTYDHNGNVVSLNNHNGAIETYRYTAFGEEEVFDSKGNKITSQNPWRYASKRFDPETSFIYFGRRYYDPETGRWITTDPAGYADGANLYAYLHHSPLLSHDAYGLYDNSWDRCNKTAGEAAANNTKINHHTRDSEIASHVKDEIFSERSSVDDVASIPYNDSIYFGYFEPVCMYFHPLCRRGGSSGVYDVNRQKKKNFGIGFINGIWNSFKSALTSSFYLSDLAGGINVDFVYNATHHHFDLLECLLGLVGISTEPTKHLHKMWDNFFHNASLEAMYLMICHSQGVIHTLNALESYPPELRDRIIVVAIAPPKYIDEELCASVTHYRNESPLRDIIPHIFDSGGATRCVKNIVNLKSHPDAPWHDHGITSPTYKEKIEVNLKKYLGSN